MDKQRSLRTIIATAENGCLYRPTVVDDLYSKVEDAVNTEVPKGIMVKGPFGIGKSHTLVNLVLKLLYGSDGKYLVTFTPDCTYFDTDTDLLDAICSSFGSTPEELGIPYSMDQTDLITFVDSVDSILKDMDKQWIFIYDQINKIFARVEFQNEKDLGTIRFPFSLIRDAMTPGRITSIISAPTDNDVGYREQHDGFEEYFHHPLSMDWNELQILYPSLADKNEDSIMKVTGGVPLQVSNLINVNFDVGR